MMNDVLLRFAYGLVLILFSRFRYTPMDQGKMFTFVGVTMTLIQGFLTRRLTNSMEGPAAMFGIFIMIPAFMMIGFCVESYQLYVGLLCYSMGTSCALEIIWFSNFHFTEKIEFLLIRNK